MSQEKNSQADLTLIAKLLTKFVQSSNTRTPSTILGFKEHIDTVPSDLYNNLQEQSREQDISQLNPKKIQTGKLQENNDPKSNRHDDPIETRVYNRNNKPKPNRIPKPTQNITNSLEDDRKFQNSITEHLKNVYPNINSVSPDMLKGLSIPTEILTKQARKAREQKKQKTKDENKPFKRQSYHVAIAYHIHLKQVKINKAV